MQRGTIIVFVVLLTGVLFNASAETSSRKQVKQGSPAASVTATAVTEAGPDKAVLEQSIYIPYKKLQDVFEKDKRGVFLPYDKFSELWKQARAKSRENPVDRSPSESLITEIRSSALIKGDVVSVKSKLTLELFKDSWNEIPLQLRDSAITRALIGPAPARIIFRKGRGYVLLYQKTGKSPKTITLELEYAKSYKKEAGLNYVSFAVPYAPIHRWEVKTEEPDVQIEIQPALAVSPIPKLNKSRESGIQAFVGVGSDVKIQWTPKAEGARGLQALTSVNVVQEERIEEGVLRTKALVTYQITRAQVDGIELELPTSQKVISVSDPNIREWNVEPGKTTRKIKIHLFEPVIGTQKLTIETEQFLSGNKQTEIAIPALKALNAVRQQGILVIKIAQGLRADMLKKTRLLQLDESELPERLKTRKWDYSYSYSSVPYDLQLRIEKVRPRISAVSMTRVFVSPEKLDVEFTAVFDIRNAGVFELPIRIPPDTHVTSVHGVTLNGTQAAAVDNHFLEKDGSMKISLSRKAMGKVAVQVAMNQGLKAENLLNEPGKEVNLTVPIPCLDPRHAIQTDSMLVLYSPESIRLIPDKTRELLPVSFKEANSKFKIHSGKQPDDQRPVLSYAYTTDKPQLSVKAEHRKPRITVRQLQVFRIDSGVVKYKVTLFYSILYSAVKDLQITVPAELNERIHIDTPGIRRQLSDDPDDKGHKIWTLSRDTEFIGNEKVDLSWETNINSLDIGRSINLALPHIIPRKADRSWGQVILAKAESIDVIPTDQRKGLRAIDPRHDLMAGVHIVDAARAFEYHGPWNLTVKATRYESKAVKASSIEAALIRFVVTRSGEQSIQGIYRMRSNRQRLVIRLPEDVKFDTQPLHLNDRPVSLEKGEKNTYFIPLAGVIADEPFLLELRYVVNSGDLALSCPDFIHEPAIQQVYLSLYLPKNRRFITSWGPWSEDSTWVMQGMTLNPEGTKTTSDLLTTVVGNLKVDKANLKSFPTDGRRILFSSLRPPGGEAGILHILALSSIGFKSTVLLVLLLAGIILLRYNYKTRTVVIGLTVILLIISGVFIKGLVWSVLSYTTLLATTGVLIIWFVKYNCYTREHIIITEAELASQTSGKQEGKEPKKGGKKDD